MVDNREHVTESAAVNIPPQPPDPAADPGLALPEGDRLAQIRNISADQLFQGVILAEVLGPPVAHRRRRGL